MNEKELLHEVIASPRRSYVPFPELEVIDEPGWLQLTCPLFPTGGFNEVSLAASVDATKVDAVLEGYARRGLQHRWQVMPDADPGLAGLLRERGLARVELLALSAPTSLQLASGPVTASEVFDVETFTAVMSAGWGAPADSLLAYHRLALDHPLHRLRFFVAMVDGEPAGCAGAFFFERSMYLLGGVVLPKFRRRGAYAALVNARLTAARQLGIGLATSHAMADTSAPILKKHGFTEHFRFTSYAPARG